MIENKIKIKVANNVKNVAVKVATHYVNVACPFFTYQPKVSKEVKKFYNIINEIIVYMELDNAYI